MILFTFKNTGKIPGHDDRTGINGRRWAFLIDNSEGATDIGFEHQCRWENRPWSGSTVGYYFLGIRWNPKKWFRSLGHEMMYYNGEHHIFGVGPFYLTWYA